MYECFSLPLKIGQIRPNKDDQSGQSTLAKCGIGQIRFGQMRPNKDGQIRFGCAVTANFVIFSILLNNADWDCFRTLILREILKIQNPLLEGRCAFSEVMHLFQ